VHRHADSTQDQTIRRNSFIYTAPVPSAVSDWYGLLSNLSV
jgi:hypothetical protein